MSTEPHDIAEDFPSGVNTADFQRAYVNELVSTAGIARGPAQQMAGGNRIEDGVRAPGSVQLVVSGTYQIEIGDLPIDPLIRTAVDTAIALQTGSQFTGPTLAEFEAGEFPGEQRYAFDGERQSPAAGLGSWTYWDGAVNWRYIRDDSIAVTVIP